jgi:hypothetical protein
VVCLRPIAASVKFTVWRNVNHFPELKFRVTLPSWIDSSSNNIKEMVDICWSLFRLSYDHKRLIDIFERSRCRFSESHKEWRSWNKNKRWSVVSLTPGNHNRTNRAFLCRNRRWDCCYSQDLSAGYHHNFSPISWKKFQTVSSYA